MNRYEILKIDGQPDWNKIPTLSVDNILWLPDAGIRMTQQICYDAEKLYIHQKAVEEHVRAEHTDVLAQVCEDSCMEFFFCPEVDSVRYFNFEWNLNGALYLGWRTDRDNAARLQLDDHKSLFNFGCFFFTETLSQNFEGVIMRPILCVTRGLGSFLRRNRQRFRPICRPTYMVRRNERGDCRCEYSPYRQQQSRSGA